MVARLIEILATSYGVSEVKGAWRGSELPEGDSPAVPLPVTTARGQFRAAAKMRRAAGAPRGASSDVQARSILDGNCLCEPGANS